MNPECRTRRCRLSATSRLSLNADVRLQEKKGQDPMKTLILVFACTALLTGTVSAQLPPEVRDQLQETSSLRITEKNLNDIWRVRPSSDDHIAAQYVILDLPMERIGTEMRNVLIDYVRGGKGLVCTFANDTARIVPPDIARNASKTMVADNSFTWLAVSAPGVTHPVLTSVHNVDFEGYFTGNYNVRGGYQIWQNSVMRTLDRDKGTPILGGRTYDGDIPGYACLLYELDAGRVAVFSQPINLLPIIQNPNRLSLHDNLRFAHNLDQWLAGFSVPGAAAFVGGGAARVSSPQAVRDSIILKNGDVISGIIESPHIEIRTSYASLKFDVSDVAHAIVEGGGRNVDSLQLHTGDRLSGMIQTPVIQIKLSTGASVELERDRIKEFRIVPRPE